MTHEAKRILFACLGIAVIVLIGAAFAFNAIVQDQARETAKKAAVIAAKEASKAEHQATKKAQRIGYLNALRSCERGIGLRLQVRANALATQRSNRVMRGFLQGARPRALAQSQDLNISPTSRVAAKGSLTSIDDGITAFSVPIKIPPVPRPCLEVITDPNAPAPPHHR